MEKHIFTLVFEKYEQGWSIKQIAKWAILTEQRTKDIIETMQLLKEDRL